MLRPLAVGIFVISIYGDPFGLQTSVSRYISVEGESAGGDLYDFGRATACMGVSGDPRF